MKINEIAKIVDGRIECCAENADKEVCSAFASDMMSDVLAFVRDQGVLITGLTNPQVVRTAVMMDIGCIVLVRGKSVDKSVLSLAEDNGIVLISTSKGLFESSGRLYAEGIKA